MSNKILNKSEELIKAAQKIARLGSWEYIPHTQELIWTDEVYKIFGIEVGNHEISFDHFLNSIHPDDKENVLNAYYSSINEGSDSYEIDHKIIQKKSGNIKIVHEKCFHERDREGNVIRSIGIVQDITERKRQEQELKHLNQLLFGITEISNAYISNMKRKELFEKVLKLTLDITQSEYGFIGEVLHDDNNQPYLKTLAITNIAWNEETRNFYDFHAPKGMEFRNLKTLFGEVLTTGEVVISNDAKHDDRSGGLPEGHPPLNAFLGIPVKLGNKLVGMMGVSNRLGGYNAELYNFLHPLIQIFATIISAMRIQEEKELNEIILNRHKEDEMKARIKSKELELSAKVAIEGNKAKSLFLANISHEIRTPMNSILGMSHLTLQTNLDDVQHEYLSNIQRAGNTLLNLINDVLDYSKIEAGKAELDLSDFKLQVVISAVNNLVQVSLAEKNIKLDVSIERYTPQDLVGDSHKLTQVLTNLVSNAVKFSYPGSKVSLNVTLSEENKDEAELLFSVIDNGIGIPLEKQKMLFSLFTQADSSTTRRYGGTGLGLSISKKIIELMGGKIWVKSKEGVGSTFCVKVSLKKQTADYSDIKHVNYDNSQDVNKTFEKIRHTTVLLVDDNHMNLQIAKELLKKHQVTVKTADNGQEALELISNHNFDAVFMDCQMPEMDGYETTTKIREQKKYTDLPIIAMTANAMHSDIQKALASGMNDHLAKPYLPEDMYLTLAKWVK